MKHISLATKLEVTQLINLVRQHAFLYDNSLRDYRNIGLKADTWESIAKELKKDVAEVKLRWTTIKDSYLKFKRQKESESPGRQIPDYVWKDQLKFLDQHQVIRQCRVTRASPPVELDTDSSSAPSPVPSTSGARSHADGHRAKRRRTSSNNSNINKKLISILGERQEYDDVDHLFKSYAKTFKKLSSQQQAHMKVEMAKLFANAELELAYNQQPLPEVSSNQYVISNIHMYAESVKIEP